MSRTYGILKFVPKLDKKDNSEFYQDVPAHFLMVDAEPHVCIKLKSVFEKLSKTQLNNFKFSTADDVCHDLLWFTDRYPMQMDDITRRKLKAGSRAFQTRVREMENILSEGYVPAPLQLNEPYQARPYQLKGAELWRKMKKILLCDDMGLGKSLTAVLGLLDPKTRPAMVVCQTHLPEQWKKGAIEKFTNLSAHIIRTGPVYKLPPADVYIIPYSRLVKWADVLAKTVKSTIFDEVQELRRKGNRYNPSQKYAAAKEICKELKYVIGLSGTPIYNYGIEIFNILNCINEGCVGSLNDFGREWGWEVVKDPAALGTYLRENFLLLRRTTEDVDRELPKLNTIVKTVSYDEKEVEQNEALTRQLAMSYLSSTNFTEKGQLAMEFNLKLRHDTGVAKARSVAALVRILLENSRPVLLSGWHRDVYDIWLSSLKEFNPVMFTGSETPKEKEKAVEKFMSGETNLFIISNRSGVGLDGLQYRCRDVVIGELDWSPQVHGQIIARVNRDGKMDGHVTVYYPVCDYGSDQPMIEVLGLKTEQAHGIVDPLLAPAQQHTDESHIKKMAEDYLQQHGARKYLDEEKYTDREKSELEEMKDYLENLRHEEKREPHAEEQH